MSESQGIVYFNFNMPRPYFVVHLGLLPSQFPLYGTWSLLEVYYGHCPYIFAQDFLLITSVASVNPKLCQEHSWIGPVFTHRHHLYAVVVGSGGGRALREPPTGTQC